MTDDATLKALDRFLGGQGPFVGLGLDSLMASYNWPLPKNTSDLIGELGGANRLEQTILLKRKLSQIWHAEPYRQFELASWIVADWGGVRGNSTARMRQHLLTAQMDDPVTPFQGLSSYSKILAVRDPDRFAILDARVVVALNALQLLSKSDCGYAFPYIQGRNLVTGHQSRKRGFACLPHSSTQFLVKTKGWHKVRRDDAYEHYLRILRAWLGGGQKHANLMQVEMALFSQAEDLAKRAAPELVGAQASVSL